MVSDRKSKILCGIATGFGVAVLLLWSLGPIYWVVVTSLKTAKEIYAFPPTLYPVTATLANYRAAKVKIGGGISADHVAQSILFAYKLPQNVLIQEICITPTRQGY